MHNQTVQNIKVLILPLDGIIFDLNRYRYNYYKHYCSSKNIHLEKKEFYSHLSNMYDMYKGLPLSQNVDIGPLNAKIERELSQYLHYKGLQPKEGLLELIEYAQQKEIKLAVISTHRTKDAVKYLKLANIYNQFHFIIGSDTMSMPLPSPQILETVSHYFQVENKEVLVISPFLSLNLAAYSLQMNIIFCDDLMEPGLEEKNTSYKTVKNLFEALNILLFDRYEDAQIYSPILGMNDQMSKEELNQVYQKLQNTYSHDQEILNLIEQTYQYHMSCLNEHNIKDASISLSHERQNHHSRYFTFDDEDADETKKINNKEEQLDFKNIDEEVKEKNLKSSDIDISSPIIHTLDENEEKELSLLLQQLKQKEQKKKSIFIDDSAFDDNNSIVSSHKKVEDDDQNQEHSFLLLIINFLYILSLSFLILFIGIIFVITFIHHFENSSGIFMIIKRIFDGYYFCVESLFQIIFNGLHTIIPFIPSYKQYCSSITIFSHEGIQLLDIYIFNSLIIILFKFIYSLYQKKHH